MEASNYYEIEFALLSIMCQHKEVLGVVSDKLRPEFFNDTNRILYLAISELYSLSLSIDILTIQHILKRISGGDRVPQNIVSSLFNEVEEVKFESYLRVLIERYKQSQLKLMAHEVQKALSEGKSSIVLHEIVSKFTHDINLGINRPKIISAIGLNIEREIEERILDGSQEVSNYVKFGIHEIDRRDRMRSGNIYVYAGKPASGKTSMAIQSLYENCFLNKKRCVFFTLEMTEEEVYESFYCFHHKIDNETYLKMSLHTRLSEIKLFRAYLEANGVELIIDGNSQNIEDIVSMAKILYEQKPIDMIVIDFLQIIRTTKKTLSRKQEIDYYLNEIKLSICKKFKFPVILISQMNRNSEANGDLRIPVMSDLAESSGIEQLACSIFFCHRANPEIKPFFDDEGRLENRGQTLFICVKARFSETGVFQSWFVGRIKRFVSTEEEMHRLIKESEEKCLHYLKK